jgi:hypothetical protein
LCCLLASPVDSKYTFQRTGSMSLTIDFRYLLRAELIALHGAANYPGAQLYMVTPFISSHMRFAPLTFNRNAHRLTLLVEATPVRQPSVSREHTKAPILASCSRCTGRSLHRTRFQDPGRSPALQSLGRYFDSHVHLYMTVTLFMSSLS